MSTPADSSQNAEPRRRVISRRQYLDGLAAAAANPALTGAQAATMSRPIAPLPIPPGYNPGRSTGITGTPDSVIDGVMQIDGFPNPSDVHDASGGPGIRRPAFNTGETYDVVVVGAGISGLSAAKYYRDRFGADAKILLVDPLPDFGGHAPHRVPHPQRGDWCRADATAHRRSGQPRQPVHVERDLGRLPRRPAERRRPRHPRLPRRRPHRLPEHERAWYADQPRARRLPALPA